jgi:hypothetical protein
LTGYQSFGLPPRNPRAANIIGGFSFGHSIGLPPNPRFDKRSVNDGNMGCRRQVPHKAELNMTALDTRVAFNGVAEAAQAAGLKPRHIRQALASGELQSHAVGRRTVILKDNLIEFIRSTSSRLKQPVLILMRSPNAARMCAGTSLPANTSGSRFRNSYVPEARLCM